MKEKKSINVEIGLNVKHARENAGFTQERFAEMIGLGEKHVSAIECGAVGLSLTSLRKICNALSISSDAILFGTPADDGGERAAASKMLAERLERLPDEQFWEAKDIVDKLLAALMK